MDTVYLGYFRGSQYTPEYVEDEGPGIPPPKATICAAKCTRWWLKQITDDRGGLCWECWCEQFEGEADLIF